MPQNHYLKGIKRVKSPKNTEKSCDAWVECIPQIANTSIVNLVALWPSVGYMWYRNLSKLSRSKYSHCFNGTHPIKNPLYVTLNSMMEIIQDINLIKINQTIN